MRNLNLHAVKIAANLSRKACVKWGAKMNDTIMLKGNENSTFWNIYTEE